MYSLNVPVPERVSRLAAGLAANCRTADVRTRHTLLVKRLGESEPRRLADRAREAVAGTAPFDARATGIGTFERPVSGTAPVVYLAIESPGLVALHGRLCGAFDPVPDLEGEAYVPHVTVARGGDARRILDAAVDPVTWTVERLALWDGTYGEPIESVSLPA